MNIRMIVFAAAAATMALAGVAQASTSLDADLKNPPGVYYGTDNHNGHFTIESFGSTDAGEFALRGHQRFQDATSPMGNVYTVALGDQASVDFSFNPFGTDITGLSSLLTITNVATGHTASFDPVLASGYHAAAFPGSAQDSEYLGFGFLNGSPVFNVGNIDYNSAVNSTYEVQWTVSGTNFAAVTDTIFINQGAGAAVPEPAAWAMMLVGFGGLGAVLRSTRRQRGAATA
jgi:hypothetical protein